MAPPKFDKIKKAIVWIRKTLEITERTTNPGTILGEIRPAIDILGWDRYSEIQSNVVALANTDRVSSSIVPIDFMLFYLAISGETNDAVNAFTHWLEIFHAASGNTVAVTAPTTLPVSAATIIRVGGLPKPVLAPPGDSMRARTAPATAGGVTLTIRSLFIDLPLGEYMKSL